MEKKRGFSEKVEAFFAGKGFYIVLILCIAVIGVSTWIILTGTGANVAADTELAGNRILPTEAPNRPASETPNMETGIYPPDTELEVMAPAVTEAEEPEPVSEPEAESYPQETETVFGWPVAGEIETPYSVDALIYNRTMADWRTHSGIDIAAELGTQVMTVAPGTVESIYTDDLLGVTIVIAHNGGLRSIYSNLAEQPTVYEGDSVIGGEVIGAIGTSAIAEAGEVTHLHFAMTLNGESVDPANYLP